MKTEMYHMMYQTETYHWYFKAKYKIVLSLLKKYGIKKKRDCNIIDFGCGCGVMLKYLSHYGTVTGVDYSEEALKYCRQNFKGDLEQADLEIYRSEKKYDFGIALDVIEHIDKDQTAIYNMQKAMNINGICVFTVPAFMGLWTKHDQNCMHKRRYTKKELENKIVKSGFQLEYCSYYNFWSFPAVFFIRKVENLIHFNNKGSKLEYGFKNGWMNQLLYRIFVSEKRRILKEKRFPFGISLICVVRKMGENVG